MDAETPYSEMRYLDGYPNGPSDAKKAISDPIDDHIRSFVKAIYAEKRKKAPKKQNPAPVDSSQEAEIPDT